MYILGGFVVTIMNIACGFASRVKTRLGIAYIRVREVTIEKSIIREVTKDYNIMLYKIRTRIYGFCFHFM
ncbi:hypothetical protein LXL04_011513 [Taraxacum kok-saghyz]